MSNIVKFFTAGNVDDGKSTLIGRLLYELGAIPIDQVEQVKQMSGDELDYSLFIEGFESEIRQKITIDVAYRYFTYNKQKFIIADSPGHEQYTKNMAVAAGNSDIVIILIDATKGIKQQTIRHTYIAGLLGIKHFIIAINKMDAVDNDKILFEKIKQEYLDKTKFLTVDNLSFIPISAKLGDNLVKRSNNINWYKGKSLLETLSDIKIIENHKKNIRFLVQNVVKYEDKRYYQGRVLADNIKLKNEIYLGSSSAEIENIIHSGKEVDTASEGSSISIVISKELDVDRGALFSNKENKPIKASKINADIIWFSEKNFESQDLLVKINHNIVTALVDKVNHYIDINTITALPTTEIRQNQIANVDIDFSKEITFDKFQDNKNTGAFFLIDKATNETLACGLVK